ncbi:MAG: transketolase [Planctomycetaceae bacterium]|jgi:transketolase|nr:transketolase [Planctomycetaceae bacterium]
MDSEDIELKKLELMARNIRRIVLNLGLAAKQNGSHIGPGLSIVEIMAILYGRILKFDSNNPYWEERDRFILSKGHGALGYYAALAESKIISDKDINSFDVNGGLFPSQPILLPSKGIESASGSLGIGLSFAIGIAIAIKKRGLSSRVFVLMGDGECNEGTVWESAMSCSHFKLDNIVTIIDHNKMQSDGICVKILDMKDIVLKWQSFGFNVISVDGHNIQELWQTFESILNMRNGKPSVIIANTIKGKGVSFMENNPLWHHNYLTQNDYNKAIEECFGNK